MILKKRGNFDVGNMLGNQIKKLCKQLFYRAFSDRDRIRI
jgi:hypothetical protein